MAVAIPQTPDTGGGVSRPVAYGWLVFALVFGLLISDYMARQVLNAVFPLLKAEWNLSDGQLGALSGIVAVMVGLLTFPLSLAADRLGRIRALAAMAVLWSLATLFCGLAQNYEQMFAGRLLVGLGEAAYGSVGIAVVVSVFPRSMRATLSGAFMAGGLVGQVLGVGIGGLIAAEHGWRMAFVAIALGGLALGVLFPLLVKERRVVSTAAAMGNAVDHNVTALPPLRSLFAGRALICAYLGSGVQLYVAGTLPAWLPSYIGRYYNLGIAQAASLTALFLAISGAGMLFCGMISDRATRFRPGSRFPLAAIYSVSCAIALAGAFMAPVGQAQLVMLGTAAFFAAATAGPASASVADLTPAAIHSTAFATLTLANNVLGLAPGPIVTGALADRIGLLAAMQLLPVACIIAAAIFMFGWHSQRTGSAGARPSAIR